MDTFMISTIFPYLFKNSSSRMFYMWDELFKLFFEQLTFLMDENLLSSSLRQSPSNSYKDSESNSYLTKIISLMVVMLSSPKYCNSICFVELRMF